VQREGVCPELLRFYAFFQTPRFGYFSEKLRKNALDIIEVPMKNEYSTIDYIPLLTFFLDFLRGVPHF